MEENGNKPKKTRTLRKRKPLTVKEELFVETLPVVGWNATEAARRAGYGGNDVTLAAIGSENLRKPHILSRVRARVEGAAASADEVLALLASHLSCDVADFRDCWNDHGELDLEKAQQKGISRNIKKLIYTPVSVPLPDGSYTIKNRVTLEMQDSQGAAAQLAKILGLVQKPGAGGRRDDQDEQKTKDAVFAHIIEMTRNAKGCSEEEARAWVIANVPEASGWGPA